MRIVRSVSGPLAAGLLAVSLLSAAGEQPAAARAETDVIRFFDGSSLRGRLGGMEPERGVLWEHPDASAPVRIGPDNIESIRLAMPAIAAPPAVAASCRFALANGDEFFGHLQSLDEQSAKLETWFGKSFHVSRNDLESVQFLSKSMKTLYQGPVLSEWDGQPAGPVPPGAAMRREYGGWVLGQNPNTWRYEDGALVTSRAGTVGRDFKLPSAARIEFDLSWSGDFRLMASLFTDTVDRFEYSADAYLMHFGGGSVSLQRAQRGRGAVNLGSAGAMPPLAQDNSCHVEIRASRDDAALAVMINGILVQKWKDEGGFAGKGSGVVFLTQMEGPTVRLANIRVSEWDGRLEDRRPADMTNRTDVVRLINRDQASGEIRGLDGGGISVVTPELPLVIPLERVSQIYFARNDTADAPRHPWEIRAVFHSGEKLTFRAERWSGGRLAGNSAGLGAVDLDASSVRQIQFNLGRASGSASRTGGDGWEADAAAGAANEALDTLVLRNGDLLLGNWMSFDPASGLRWKRTDMPEPAVFRSGSVAEIRFRAGRLPAVTNDCCVHLSNGNQIEGALRSVTAKEITLDTALAGVLALPRERVMMLVPLLAKSAVVYDGPDGLDGWTSGKVTAVPDGGEWTYADGAFYATKAASIARDVKLPDVAKIRFDLRWKGALQEAVALYTSSLQPVSLANKDADPEFQGGFYSLQLNSLSALIMVVTKDEPLRYLMQMPVPLFDRKNSAHIEIRVNKPLKTISLLVDGMMINQVTESAGFAGTGTALRFVHQGLGSVRVSNLRVTEWDGLISDSYTNGRGAEDLLKFRGREKLAGELAGFRDGRFIFTSKEGPREVPMDQVRQVELAGVRMQMPEKDSAAVKARLRTGADLDFRIEQWGEQGIRAASPNFGRAVLNPSAFEWIRFGQGE